MSSTRPHEPTVCGFVASGFEDVRREFARNLSDRGELGGACALFQGDELLVDLWGGTRDLATGAPWERGTLVTVFSATKGMAAAAMTVAISRGVLDLDALVADYWPQFARAGKDGITVRQLLAHEAGVCAMDEPVPFAVLSDRDALSALLSRQSPAWEPGRFHGYHGLTLGLYESELLRHADPHGRSIGRFFAEEVASPVDAEFYIGAPGSIPESRYARVEMFSTRDVLRSLKVTPVAMALALLWPGSLTARTLLNPRMRSPLDMTSSAYRAIEFPSGSGVGTARGIARIYGALATSGLGISRHMYEALTSPPRMPPGGARDRVLKVDTAYACGFWKRCGAFPAARNDGVFGAHGAGGSIGFADPELGIGYGYVTNRMSARFADDPRERALREACYTCLSRRGR